MDKTTVFDTLFTANHIQILKLLLPIFPRDRQYFFAIFIKMLEILYMMEYGTDTDTSPDVCASEHFDYTSLCNDVLPFCTKEETQTVKSIMNMFQTFETMKEMSGLFELLGQTEGGLDVLNGLGSLGSLDGDMLGSLVASLMGSDMGENLAASFMAGDMGGSEIFDNLSEIFNKED